MMGSRMSGVGTGAKGEEAAAGGPIEVGGRYGQVGLEKGPPSQTVRM